MNKFDLAVIGAGPGGYPTAIRAAQLGAKVAIIEQDQLGGTCLNSGCIPTKTFLAHAELVAQCRQNANSGLKFAELQSDYPALLRHKDGILQKFRLGVQQLLKLNGVTLFSGQAAFTSSHELTITPTQGATTTIEAEKIVIATGSESTRLPHLPDGPQIVDSRAFLALPQLPKSLIIVGGGYIGCELATFAAQLGVKVDIVEALDDILLLLDKDVRLEVRRSLERNLQVNIYTGARLEHIRIEGGQVQGTINNETLTADLLLYAVGRQARTAGLNLEGIGIKVDAKGAICVDEHYRTNLHHIFAIGDVNGKMQLAHAATAQGLQVAAMATGHKAPDGAGLVPAVIFTHPEVAQVGVTEADLAKGGLKVSKFPYAFLGRAVAANEAGGFAKIISEEHSGRIVGAAIVGARATDLIGEMTLAIRHKLTVEDLANTIHAHPTFGEIWAEAAHMAENKPFNAPPARR